MILQRPSFLQIKSFHKLNSKKEKETENKVKDKKNPSEKLWVLANKGIHVKYTLTKSTL